jgi:hypothetical protein
VGVGCAEQSGSRRYFTSLSKKGRGVKGEHAMVDMIVNGVMYIVIPCFAAFFISAYAFRSMTRQHERYMEQQRGKFERELDEIQALRDRVAHEMKRRAGGRS